MLLGVFSTAARALGWQTFHESYFNVPPHEKGAIAAAYFALIAALLLAMRENNKRRLTPRQLQAIEAAEKGEAAEGEGAFQGVDGVRQGGVPAYYKSSSSDSSNHWGGAAGMGLSPECDGDAVFDDFSDYFAVFDDGIQEEGDGEERDVADRS